MKRWLRAEPRVSWSVDLTGTGNSYQVIRSQDMSVVGAYNEALCYPFISFWQGWTPDGPGCSAAQSHEACECGSKDDFDPVHFGNSRPPCGRNYFLRRALTVTSVNPFPSSPCREVVTAFWSRLLSSMTSRTRTDLAGSKGL